MSGDPLARFLIFLLVLFVPLSAFGSQSDAADASPLIAYNGLLVGDDARARLVIDFDRKPAFNYHYMSNPARLILTLPSTSFSFSADSVEPRGMISDIRYGTTGPGQSRVILTATQPFQLTLAETRENEAGGARLVIDLAMTDAARFQKLIADQAPLRDDQAIALSSKTISNPADADVEKDGFLVAVDAGHGGIDTGAIGEDSKTLEKDITLEFARTFAKKLEEQPGLDAYLTRDSDVYLSLSQRVELARQHDADLFISLHADSLSQPDISGATVYTLSDRASDRLAAALARRENLSNKIAGLETATEPEEVTDILLDLTRRETQSFSINLADRVVESFKGQIGLINNPHRYAGFMVLRAPDIPSILLEIGFLSNPQDEARMQDPVWRDKLIERLVDAVKAYHKPTIADAGE